MPIGHYRLPSPAGIATPSHELLQVGGRSVLLSRRFDRAGAIRIPFLVKRHRKRPPWRHQFALRCCRGERCCRGSRVAAAREIFKGVAVVTATWRVTTKEAGARSAEITRMASAFEHDDLKRALAF